MIGRPLSMPVKDWPVIDQLRYCEALQPVSFLSAPSPARKWSAQRRRIVEQAYGQWLAFLDRHGWLDQHAAPETKVSKERMSLFVKALQARVASWSTAMMVQACAKMFQVLAPETDWQWLRPFIRVLKATAKVERDKRPHMVDARQVFQLGLRLMQQATEEADRYHAATCMRDGLLIALLMCAPIRIANLAAIKIGEHLTSREGTYRLAFEAEETKNGRPFEAWLPPELSQYVDVYLRQHRKQLLARGQSPDAASLWINRWGAAMREGCIRTQIEKRTKAAFGKHIWPHLFRTIAASSFVDHDPEQIALVTDLLGHADQQTAQRYYILADGALAHAAVQSSFEADRAAALARLKQQRGRQDDK